MDEGHSGRPGGSGDSSLAPSDPYRLAQRLFVCGPRRQTLSVNHLPKNAHTDPLAGPSLEDSTLVGRRRCSHSSLTTIKRGREDKGDSTE